jgi:hypothetical protein
MFINIIKRYLLNILKKYQQYYLITKQKLNENETNLQRKKNLKLNYQQIKCWMINWKKINFKKE